MAVAALLAGPALGQQVLPRTPDGHPDFQGVWESRWRTPLQRPDEAAGPTMSREAAEKLLGDLLKRDEDPSEIPTPSDSEYAFYMPAGPGLFRTSQIVEPENGKLPLSENAKAMAAEWRRRLELADGPEARMIQERCLGGPGRAPLPITPANMFRRIVQTPDNVVILTEDMNEVRVIGIGAPRNPAAMTSFDGDSIAHWEGDTLVVETSNFAAPSSFRGLMLGPNSVVTERFTLTQPDEISFEFGVTDKELYTGPWRAQYVLRRSNSFMLEGTCHEGNYALANILSGARVTEQQAATAKR
ncbi:MAG: hypothetical protein ABI740_04885 [Alphaproteobacteria bacterium]